jgi:serine protease AprX
MTVRLRHLALVLAGCVVLAVQPAGAAEGPARIVAFDELPRDAVKRLRKAGITHAALFPAADAAAVLGSPAAYRRLKRFEDVVAVYPEQSFELMTFQTKPSLGVDVIHAGGAPLTRRYTGKGVTVAVFDTGIEDAHRDLDDRVAANLQFEGAGVLDPISDGQYSQANPETAEGVDELQHGTLAAGIVAGTGESASGADMRGMAPEATLVNFKIIGQATHEHPESSTITETNALAAYQWMIDHRTDARFPGGIRVATNSWGWDGDFEPPAFTRMLESARDAGIALVFAAGNTGPGPDTVAFPGRLDWIITAGASCKAQGVWSARCPDGPGKVADFSSRGAGVDVLAPGVDTWGAAAKVGFENTAFTPIGQLTSPGSTAPPPPGAGNPADEVSNRAQYLYGAGTSFATPHVAGIVALMVEANPALTQAQIEAILQRTATDLGREGFDPDNGHGHIDALKAVELAARPAPAPVVAPGPSGDPLGSSAPSAAPQAGCAAASKFVRIRRARITVRCQGATSVRARLTLPRAVAKKLRLPAVLATGRAAVTGQSTRVALRLGAGRRLRRLSATRLRSLRPSVELVAADAAGAISRSSAPVRLRR